MEKYRAIPEGYMTVGEVAKKMGTTVRTLQYYDKEGILSPSAESEGGRRLYTDKDVIQLHQILSMKSLGFSLGDIKHRILSLDTPAQVAEALTDQSEAIRRKMAALSESLEAIEALKGEVLQMQSVDFRKYADIIISLQLKNDSYWIIKHFDDKTLDHFHGFDDETALAMMETMNRIWDDAIRLRNNRVTPESEAGAALAKEFWNLVLEITGGDMSMLTDMIKLGDHISKNDAKWAEKHALAHAFLSPALDAYFTSINYNPLPEELT